MYIYIWKRAKREDVHYLWCISSGKSLCWHWTPAASSSDRFAGQCFCCLHCQQITQTTLTGQSVFIYRVVLICFYSKPLTWLEDLQYDKDINWYQQHCQQQQNLKRLQLNALQYSVRSSTGARTHKTRHLVISIPFHARAKLWISQNVKLFFQKLRIDVQYNYLLQIIIHV